MVRKLTKEYFQEQGRLGGKKAWEKKSKAQKQAAASKAVTAYWARLTPEERSAELKRRAVVRAKNAKKRKKKK